MTFRKPKHYDSEDMDCIKCGKHYRLPDTCSERMCPTCQKDFYYKKLIATTERQAKMLDIAKRAIIYVEGQSIIIQDRANTAEKGRYILPFQPTDVRPMDEVFSRACDIDILVCESLSKIKELENDRT